MKLLKYALYLLLAYLLLMRPPLSEPLVNYEQVLPQRIQASLGTAQIPGRHGVDMSHFQGQVDFEVLSRHIDFVYLKATQGDSYTDPTYVKRVEQLQKTSLFHGAYHFFDPTIDALNQARYFVSRVKEQQHSLPPVLDVELLFQQTPQQLQQGVNTWLTYVQQALNCKPIIYTDLAFWRQNLAGHFSSYSLWLADYRQLPTTSLDKSRWKIWQYSQQGRVPGIEHSVDLDLLLDKELGCYVG